MLSVSGIVREAGISRANFYAHYASLDELALALHQSAFAQIATGYSEASDAAESMLESQRRLVAHYVENLAFYRTVSKMPVSREAYLAGVRAMAEQMETALRSHPEAISNGSTSATARYIAGAAYGLIDAWVSGEIELSEDELVERLTSMLPTWFSGIRGVDE